MHRRGIDIAGVPPARMLYAMQLAWPQFGEKERGAKLAYEPASTHIPSLPKITSPSNPVLSPPKKSQRMAMPGVEGDMDGAIQREARVEACATRFSRYGLEYKIYLIDHTIAARCNASAVHTRRLRRSRRCSSRDVNLY